MVRHAGNVVADHAMGWLASGQFRIMRGHPARVREKEAEKGVESRHGTLALFGNRRMGVQPGMQKQFQFGIMARRIR